MMSKERLERQMNFALEADKEKKILRQTHLSDCGRPENDAEHAWHMALMVYLLREYADEEIDAARAVIMALIHDLVEIDAGDTYAYDEEGQKTRKEREAAAAERVFGLLPEDQERELKSLFREFEAAETPEARFVRAMDNFQPLLLNDSNDGRDWKEHGVGITQVMKRHAGTGSGSAVLYERTLEILEDHVKRGNIRDDRE